LITLNNLLKGKGIKGLLERSFFVDPEGRLRPSRSGLVQEASLRDILSGQITFRKPKPQVLVFSDISVERLPSYLKDVELKLKNRAVLSERDIGRLLEFQLKKSGKFKPIGFGSGEPELTLAPGEIIYRRKVVGVTLINGRKTPIVLAGVRKASPELSELIRRFKEGSLRKAELRLLERILDLVKEKKLTRDGLKQACLIEGVKYSAFTDLLNRSLRDSGEKKTLLQMIDEYAQSEQEFAQSKRKKGHSNQGGAITDIVPILSP